MKKYEASKFRLEFMVKGKQPSKGNPWEGSKKGNSPQRKSPFGSYTNPRQGTIPSKVDIRMKCSSYEKPHIILDIVLK